MKKVLLTAAAVSVLATSSAYSMENQFYCPKFGGRTPHLQCVVSTYNIERCNIIKKQATQYMTAHTI